MDLNIKGINDLYSERYITTINLINQFRAMNFSCETEEGSEEETVLEPIKVNNIAIELLNNHFAVKPKRKSKK